MSELNHVPMSDWGKDHWSTLAYVEVRAVDHGGKLRIENLRANSHHWAIQIRWRPRISSQRDYPTRLKDREIDGHDDWDCLLDMEREGLLIIDRPTVMWFPELGNWMVMTANYPDALKPGEVLMTGLMESEYTAVRLTNATYRLTEKGQRVAGDLRSHLQRERKFATFVPSVAMAVS